MKKILSLDLGITSIGYSILDEIDNDRYSLVDYGVSMFDKATDKDGKSKKLLHSASQSSANLHDLRKQRTQNLAMLFEKYKLASADNLLRQEQENRYVNKWYLRAEKSFSQMLEIEELFTVLYLMAKHRGYKSLDTDDLLEELLIDLEFEVPEKKEKDAEKGKIKQALKTVEALRKEYPEKTVARIIYEIEIQKSNPTFRNHDNYNYMIRREYIREEIEKIVLSQKDFGLFTKTFDVDAFIKELIATIDDQKDSTNDLSLFGNCEYYPKEKIAHQYSLLSDIYKMYESVSNLNFGQESNNITAEQIKLVADDFFYKLLIGTQIDEITYKNIRSILKLSDETSIYKKNNGRVIKFHFVSCLKEIDNTFIINIFKEKNKLEILEKIFDVLKLEKAPKQIYTQLTVVFNKYKLLEDKELQNKTIISLIKEKHGNSMDISTYAMKKFIPYFEQGLRTIDIKRNLNLKESEDYSQYKKGIKYLGFSFDKKLLIKVENKEYEASQFEFDDKLLINNHPVKYVVSATMRLVKHLHSTYGAFDEIRVESTRELSLPTSKDVARAKKEKRPLSKGMKTRESIDKANRENEAKFQKIIEDKEYQKIAKHYNKNLKKYARKIMLWEEQDKRDIYSNKSIGMDDIFSNAVDIDHIIPQSLGGLSVKHNLVLAHRDENTRKSNQLPMNFVKNKEQYINEIEEHFNAHRINWKKKINLLAETLDDGYKDTFESKSLRATSYIEALTVQMLKRYYPFPDKKKQANGQAVAHVQGRATSNIRKLLGVKTKVRDTNIHHAIDAILIGLTNKSWLQKLSNTFRENMGVIDDEARANIKKEFPIIELVTVDNVEYLEPKDIVEKIEDAYNVYGENSIFYKDIFGKIKAVNFWVSKKPMSSKIHKDTIYGKKQNGFFTVREDIIKQFIALKITTKTDAEVFEKSFEKSILHKMYSYKTNPNDVICGIIQNRASEIKKLLESFVKLDYKNKETMSEAKENLEALVHAELLDNNGNTIRKVKFYQRNLTGFDVRGGLATKEKTFIGFKATYENKKLNYERIDASNFKRIEKENDGSFKVYKNDVVFFVYEDDSVKGGKIVSFLADKSISAFSNPKFPSASEFQPESFSKMDKGKKSGSKQQSINKAIGIIKLNLDILGNIKSYTKFGKVSKEVEAQIFHRE